MAVRLGAGVGEGEMGRLDDDRERGVDEWNGTLSCVVTYMLTDQESFKNACVATTYLIQNMHRRDQKNPKYQRPMKKILQLAQLHASRYGSPCGVSSKGRLSQSFTFPEYAHFAVEVRNPPDSCNTATIT